MPCKNRLILVDGRFVGNGIGHVYDKIPVAVAEEKVSSQGKKMRIQMFRNMAVTDPAARRIRRNVVMLRDAPEIEITAAHLTEHFRKREQRRKKCIVHEDQLVICRKPLETDPEKTLPVSPDIKTGVDAHKHRVRMAL